MNEWYYSPARAGAGPGDPWRLILAARPGAGTAGCAQCEARRGPGGKNSDGSPDAEAILDSINSPIVFADNTMSSALNNRPGAFHKSSLSGSGPKSLFDCHHTGIARCHRRSMPTSGGRGEIFVRVKRTV
jgi:hypothetical protein